jgi:hypothetical protein
MAGGMAGRFAEGARFPFRGGWVRRLVRREEALACYGRAKELGMKDTMRHDQYGIVIDANWIEARLKTPFVRPNP